MKKLFIAILTVAMMTTAMPSLNQTSFITEVEAAVKMNKTKATIVKGKTLTLKVLGTKKKVTWSSSNKNVATVSSKGKVTAKKKGTCTITAKVGTKKYRCKITVKNPPVQMNKSKATVVKSKTLTLKVLYTSKKVTWTSNNKKIATVSSKGKVTAKKKGTCTITAKVAGKKYTCKITVKNPTTKLNKTSLAMQVGDTYILKATSDGASKTVKWKTSNNSIVSVSTKGKVTAKKIGTAKITATMNGVSKTITVKVSEESVVGSYKFSSVISNGISITQQEMSIFLETDFNIIIKMNANNTFKMTVSFDGYKESTNGTWEFIDNQYVLTVPGDDEVLYLTYTNKKLTMTQTEIDKDTGETVTSKVIFKKFIP